MNTSHEKPEISNTITGSLRLAKVVSLLIIVSTYMSVWLSVYAYQRSIFSVTGIFGLDTSVIAGIGATFVFITALLVYVLQRLQDGTYWFSWAQMAPGGVRWLAWFLQIQKGKLDERQQFKRQKVFQRSYGVGIIIAWLMFLNGSSWSQSAYNQSARDSLLAVLSWVFIIFLLGLPALIGAWTKDNYHTKDLHAR